VSVPLTDNFMLTTRGWQRAQEVSKGEWSVFFTSDVVVETDDILAFAILELVLKASWSSTATCMWASHFLLAPGGDIYARDPIDK
jgi:hypothetical protein